jgi:hypothetical protein
MKEDLTIACYSLLFAVPCGDTTHSRLPANASDQRRAALRPACCIAWLGGTRHDYTNVIP